MTGNDVTWPEVTGSDPELMSFDRNSPGRCCRRPISQVLGTFEHLQGCNSEVSCDRNWHHVTGSDPEVTSFDRSPKSGCTRPISQVFVTFELLQSVNSQQVAVT